MKVIHAILRWIIIHASKGEYLQCYECKEVIHWSEAYYLDKDEGTYLCEEHA